MLTGRAVDWKKNIVENTRKLDVVSLQREKVFSQGPETKGTICWQNENETTYSIRFTLVYSKDVPNSLCLDYAISGQGDGIKELLFYHIRVTWTPCRYGGKRWWFICPVCEIRGKIIRRCRILYLPKDADFFGCRECYNLSYESRQKHRSRLYEEYVKQCKILDSISAMAGKRMSAKKRLTLHYKFVEAEQRIIAYLNSSTAREWDRMKSKKHI